ncbi:expressed unknown protein [Ectocarpus siliculosus]|uniref:Uncharacterized protein n=2 Tax=Ectocarpus siliculosus TaxID=2880 RepID=D7FIQ1_ECTSI|nr:expressed unknown protein [Ectocarpus siliculosus]|eukprot:CBJ28869.1 expressed unknown protein [Ectocarpus siliculosus]
MTSVYFMGPLGKGSWHEWERDHVFSLLGMVWYNTSRSESSNANFQRWKRVVQQQFPDAKPWLIKFVRPAETRWMVVMDGAKLLCKRWEQVEWLFCEYAARNLNKTTFRNYWLQSAYMLRDPLVRVHVMFTARLGELLFDWAYNWIRGKGGFFLKGEGVGRQLFPGMRLVEVADFSRLLLVKLETIRKDPKTYFAAVLERVQTTLSEAMAKLFMTNFSEDKGFFAEFKQRWIKWMERHQQLPLSMARIGCPSFFARTGIMGEGAVEQAVGPEFARAFLHVAWSALYEGEPRTEREREYRTQLVKDLGGTTDARRKDELTFGLFSRIDSDRSVRNELEQYANSGWGDKEVDQGAPKGTSALARLFDFPLLYKLVCHRFYFVPIHQQLIEAFFSKFDSCAQKTDMAEMDIVRVGGWKSAESRDIVCADATGEKIRAAGKKVLEKAREAKAVSHARKPAENLSRKRVLEPEAADDLLVTLEKEGNRRPRVTAAELESE